MKTKLRTLDQNQFSKRDLVSSTTYGILIPDVTWFENLKSPGWRHDVSRTFEAVHKAPDRLHVGYPTGELLRRELSSNTPTTDPVDWAGTERLRELLQQDDYIALIEKDVDALRSSGLEPIISLADNRRTLVDGMKELIAIGGEKLMSQFRENHRSSREPLSLYASSIAALTMQKLRRTLSSLGLSQPDASRLLNKQSVFYRTLFSYWAQIFRYAMDSPTLQRGDKNLLNDLVDSDYAIIASYTDALETDDALLRERYDALIASIKGG